MCCIYADHSKSNITVEKETKSHLSERIKRAEEWRLCLTLNKDHNNNMNKVKMTVKTM